MDIPAWEATVKSVVAIIVIRALLIEGANSFFFFRVNPFTEALNVQDITKTVFLCKNVG